MKVKIKKLNPNAVIPFKTYEKDFCYVCGEKKPLDLFVKCKRAYTGHLNICKKCDYQKKKERIMRKKSEEQCHTSSEK